ncbi:MAG: prolyl oligopeptidase family serine peptidase [Anaerolineae bacterium]|nr:prolyl oligopeptidase family serine peptidase [Anaerolineae bacterium]
MLPVDMPLSELQQYRPPQTKEPDFDSFWEHTLDQARSQPLSPEFRRMEGYPVPEVEVFRASFDGFRGGRSVGWYLRPAGAANEGKLPAVVAYHGYSGNKGQPHQYLHYALQGYAVLALDVRGQSGESCDANQYDSGHVTGWMTKGISDPEGYYYRGVYMDCVRAADLVASLPEVDPSRMGAWGVSQGGGLALAATALSGRFALTMPDVPYLCHYRRSLEIAQQGPYLELSAYFRLYPDREEQAFRTLSYFDNLNLADRITCPVLMSVGLVDLICPPSSIYATYNYVAGEKRMAVYPYHGHEVPPQHVTEQIRWANRHLRGLDV